MTLGTPYFYSLCELKAAATISAADERSSSRTEKGVQPSHCDLGYNRARDYVD